MKAKKCVPKCELMAENYFSSDFNQENVSSVKPINSHHDEEPNCQKHVNSSDNKEGSQRASMCLKSDLNLKYPKGAKCSDIKAESQLAPKSSISENFHGNQTVVHETDNKGPTDNLSAAHGRSDIDSCVGTHCRSGNDSWAAALEHYDKRVKNTSLVDEWQSHNTTISTKHGWSMSHRGLSQSPSHGSRFESERLNEKRQSRGGSGTYRSDSAGSKNGSKSSNWEKAIGLQNASRSFSSNQGTNGWEPWVAACDQTEDWNRINTNKHTPKYGLMDEKHSSTVGQEIEASLEAGDSHHVKGPKSDRHSMRAKHAKYSKSLISEGICEDQVVVQEHHPTVSTNHGWSTPHRSHSPSHGSRGLESSNWEKIVGVPGPKKVTNEWGPWVSANHQANVRGKIMTSGFESHGQHRCNSPPKHGLSHSKRGWNLSNTIKNGPEGSDKRGQTGAGGSPIPRRGFACNKDDSRSANWCSVSGDLIAKEVGISKTGTWESGTALDQADRNMPPDLGMWRRQGCSNSPKGGWNRLKRSRSRSPFPGMKFGSENWNKRVKSGTGASTGRHMKGSQLSDLQEDAAQRIFGNFTREVGQVRFEKGRYSSHHSREEFTYSAEQRDSPRDELSHWNMTYHGSDQKKSEHYRNRKPTDRHHSFAKERDHRGSACYAYEEAPSHGPWSIRDDSRQRSHDRRDSTSKQMVEPQRVGGTPCRYFVKGQCCHGQNCKFSHQLEHGHPNNRQHDHVQVHKKNTKSSPSLNRHKQGQMHIDKDSIFRRSHSIAYDLLRKTELVQSNTREGELSGRGFNSEWSQQSPAHNNGLSQQLVHSVVLKGLHEHSSPGQNTNDFPSNEQSLQGESAKPCSWPSVSQAAGTSEVAACVRTHSTTSLTSCILSTGMPSEPTAFSHSDQGFPEQPHNFATLSDKNADSKERNHCGGLDPRQVELAREINVPDYRKECSTHTEAVDPDLQADEWTRDVNGLRMLKFGLVELVKDLLKPTWKNGHMSRETHKTIVKKVVDKVVGSLKGPEIPQTQEMVDLYLSQSRSNITDLVLAYIEKYLN